MASNDVIRNALKPGQRVLWYEIETTLGQGGFGITYVARDTNLDQQVALKEYLPTELSVRENGFEVHPVSGAQSRNFKSGLEKFMLEARTLAHFDHRNIVKVYTVFEANNTAYMVMRYEDGMSLGDIYSGRRRLRERLLQHLVHPLLDGLESIHNAGFIHRDIKPDNIYLRRDASPVLLDFGSARLSAGSETRAMTSLVTPGYAPFEQYVTGSDKQGPWSDIYSFGATLYRGIAGLAPQDATNRSEALSYTGKDVLVPAQEIGAGRYSESFLRAVDAALRFRYDERPQNVAEWRAMFKAKKRSRRRRRVAEAAPPRPVVAADYSAEVEPLDADAPLAAVEPQTTENDFVTGDNPVPRARHRVIVITAVAIAMVLAVGGTAWIMRGASDSAVKAPSPALVQPDAPPVPSAGDEALTPPAQPQESTEIAEPGLADVITPRATDIPDGTPPAPPAEVPQTAPSAPPAMEDDEFAPLPDSAVTPPAAAADEPADRQQPAAPAPIASAVTNRADTAKAADCAAVTSDPFIPAVSERDNAAYATRQYVVERIELRGPDSTEFIAATAQLRAGIDHLHEQLALAATSNTGSTLSLGAMQAIADGVNRELRKLDIMASAMIPMQLVGHGVLDLLVLEWQLGEVRLSGVPARFRERNEAALKRALAPLHGQALHSRELKQTLLDLLLDARFHGSGFAILEPGTELLHTDIVLQWHNAKPVVDPAVDPDRLFIFSVSGDGALLPVSQLGKTNATLGYHEAAVRQYRERVVERMAPDAASDADPRWPCEAAFVVARYRENWRTLSARNSIAQDFKHLMR